jgi:uncharacterized membrane protein YgaE (UPF0421/DUF939 family)
VSFRGRLAHIGAPITLSMTSRPASFLSRARPTWAAARLSTYPRFGWAFLKRAAVSAFHHTYLRLALMSSAAAAIAFGIGGTFEGVNAAVAGIIALISIRPTFHDTAAESVRQLIGVVLGAAVALGITYELGYSAGALAVMILCAFLFARLLRLGEEGAAAMGVMVLLVVGPYFDADMVEARFLGVVLGAVVALVFSLWVRPGKPHMRALTKSVNLAEGNAALLTEMARYVETHHGQLSVREARTWVARADQNLIDLLRAREDAESALHSSRWSPLVDKQEAVAVTTQVRLAQVTARTTYNIASDLLTAAQAGNALPAGVVNSLAAVLNATATTITEQAQAAAELPSTTWTTTDTMALHLVTHKAAVVGHVKELDETQPILLAGSLIRDAEKITTLLTAADQAHHGPPTQENPTVAGWFRAGATRRKKRHPETADAKVSGAPR